MPEQQDQNNGTTVVQQDGALLSCNKIATMTVEQDGTLLSFNKMAHRHISTQIWYYFHTATPEKWTGRTGPIEWPPALTRLSNPYDSSTICSGSSRRQKGRTALCCSHFYGIGMQLEHLQGNKDSWLWKTSGLVSLDFPYCHNISLKLSSWLSTALYLPRWVIVLLHQKLS